MSGASERADGQASDPVLQSVFLVVLDHSAEAGSGNQMWVQTHFWSASESRCGDQMTPEVKGQTGKKPGGQGNRRGRRGKSKGKGGGWRKKGRKRGRKGVWGHSGKKPGGQANRRGRKRKTDDKAGELE